MTMQPIKALLSIRAKTSNAQYNEHDDGSEVFIPVEVVQIDYNGGGESRRFKCVLPGKNCIERENALWVPLDALRDEHYLPLAL